MKRKPLSKKTRFEVFKRDKFTCQYCGRAAPTVILHADHIEPVSKGGKNDLLNLVTACSECNGGKGPNLLSDDSVVEKKRRQLVLSQERLEQLEMIHQWNKDLMEAQNREVDIIEETFYAQCAFKYGSFTQLGKNKIMNLISRFGFLEVLESTKIAVTKYVKYDDKKEPTFDSRSDAFTKIGGICFNRANGITSPRKHVS